MEKKIIDIEAGIISVHRDQATGIARVHDGRAGCAHSAHPNISARGSMTRSTARDWWGETARTAEANGFIYNIDSLIITDELDEIAFRFCECTGCLERKVASIDNDLEKAVQTMRDFAHRALMGEASMAEAAEMERSMEEIQARVWATPSA